MTYKLPTSYRQVKILGAKILNSMIKSGLFIGILEMN